MKKRNFRIYAAIFSLCAVCCLTAIYIGPPEPEICALCGNGEGQRYQAPCILECSTGLLAELASPVEDLANPGELHVFNLACGGRVGVSVDRAAGVETCTAQLPGAGGRTKRSLFCRECRELLAVAGKSGYVLADLHDLRHVAVNPITAGAVFQLRGYMVSIFEEGERFWVEAMIEVL